MISADLITKLSGLLLQRDAEGEDRFVADAVKASTGLNNTNVVLRARGRNVVFRQYSTKNAPGGYRFNEVRVLHFLQRQAPGLAPELLYFDFSLRDHPAPFAVISFVEGEGLAPGGVRAVLKEIAGSLRRVHQVGLPPDAPGEGGAALETPADLAASPSLSPTLPSLSEADRHLLDEKLTASLAPLAEKLSQTHKFASLGRAILDLWGKASEVSSKHLARFQAAPRETLVHGDAHCGNLLKAGEELTWIDWEAAHRGHPYEDLASFVVVAFPPFSREEEGEFLKVYGEEMLDELLFGLFKMRKMVRIVYSLGECVVEQGEGVSPQISGGLQFFVNMCTALTAQLLNW
eukprot:TRINITY_DN14682_c0_g1_i1.p1 TRINITY_DN14682_c0_g1~~TRINITY_DN14682_c0_g1_i1.p1  ORF type:complete len:347 (+),score=87.35 TRINITY_DN14682_c0_g1_i1:27-1067(+)